MSSNLVSVIIPSYNRAYCIRRAINSVINQTHRNVEAIVIDDGSTDETRELLQSAYGRDPRVRYVYQTNSGVAAARNRGIALARGDFVSFLDSDDEFYLWKLSVQVACLNSLPGAGMIWTDMDAVDPSGVIVARRYLKTMYHAYRLVSQDRLFEVRRRAYDVIPDLPAIVQDAELFSGDIFSEMVMGNLVHPSTALLTRERLQRVKGFNENLKNAGEDYDLHLRTCREGPVAFLNVSSIRYQIGASDALTNPSHQLRIALNNLNTILPVIMRDRDRIRLPGRALNNRIAASYAWIAEAYIDRSECRQALPFVLKSLMYRPGCARCWVFFLFSCLPDRFVARARTLFRARKRMLKGLVLKFSTGLKLSYAKK